MTVKEQNVGAYTIYQGIITPIISSGVNNAAAPGHFDVKVGTTQRSEKVGGLFQTLLTCSNSVLTDC
jgi:hypothetical protein